MVCRAQANPTVYRPSEAQIRAAYERTNRIHAERIIARQTEQMQDSAPMRVPVSKPPADPVFVAGVVAGVGLALVGVVYGVLAIAEAVVR